MRKYLLLLVAFPLLCFPLTAGAVDFNLNGVKFGINGYIDLQYNYMSKNPTSDGMSMEESSTFQQKQLNLLFDVEKDKYRAHINLHSTNAFTTEDGEKGQWEVEEAYGEYRFNDLLSVRGGTILSPFGIFNEFRYITSVYASVVLPFIYEIPNGYSGASITPDNSNVVANGSYLGENMDLNYSLYVSNGRRDSTGEDQNKDKGAGTRVRFTVLDNYKIGASYYTVQNDKENEGREHLAGVDFEATLLEKLLLQAEYVRDMYGKKADRLSYYARLTYRMDRLSPFIMYDYFKDSADLVWKNGQNRYGVGVSYDLSENVILKAEYHFHNFRKNEDVPPEAETTNMIRAAAIFIF